MNSDVKLRKVTEKYNNLTLAEKAEVNRRFAQVYKYAYGWVKRNTTLARGDSALSAQDFTQDALEQVWIACIEYDPGRKTKLSSYVHVCLYSYLKDLLRERYKQATFCDENPWSFRLDSVDHPDQWLFSGKDEDDDTGLSTIATDFDLEYQALARCFYESVQRNEEFSERERGVVRLIATGHSFAEVAKVYNTSNYVIWTVFNNMKVRLREILDKE